MSQPTHCTQCGHPNAASSEYCTNCGNRMTDLPAASQPTETSSQLPQHQRGRPIQRWRYQALFVSIEKEQYTIRLEGRTLKGSEVWGYLDEMGGHGWELVSATAEVGSETVGMAQGLLTGTRREATVTAGYMLWFKRSIEDAA